MGIILILTRSRGGYLAGAVGLICVLYLHRKYVPAIGLTLGLIFISLWLITTLEPSPTINTVSGLADTGSFDFRLEVWKMALQMLHDFPFTGIGMGTFNDVATRLYPFPVLSNPGAHNLFLQVGVDLGILGLISYLSIICLIFLLAWQAIYWLGHLSDVWLQSAMIGAFSAMVAFVIHSLVDIAVWGTRAAFVPWIIMALIVMTYKYANKQLLIHKIEKTKL